MRHQGFSLATPLLLTSLILAACGGGGTTQAPTAAAPAAEAPTAAPAAEAPTAAPAAEAPTAAPAAEAPTAMADATAAPAAEAPAGTTDYSKIGQELADAFAGKYKGTTVSLLHGLSGEEENKFKAQWTDFQAKTGITVKLVPGSTTESIAVKAQSGTIEDIVNFPQPGTMGSYAKQGKLIDLNKFIKPEWLKENYNQGFIDTNTVPDDKGNKILGGIFNRINFKSAVWYPKKAFDEAGYKVPQTWDEMKALMDNIVADGDT